MSYTAVTRHARLLTAADEVRLAKAIEAGAEAQERIRLGVAEKGDHRLVAAGSAAHTRFMEANLRLVLSQASKMRVPRHVDRQDVIQDGMVGLDRAVGKFDWRRGYKFSTYATWWIRQSMQRGLEHTASTVRIPAHRSSELHQALANADQTGDRLTPKLAHVAALAHLDSLDRSIGDGTIADVNAAEEPGPDTLHEIDHDREVARDLLHELDPTTADAVRARFGLDGGEPASYADIGAELGVTAEAARRRVVRGLERLRPAARARTTAVLTAA